MLNLDCATIEELNDCFETLKELEHYITLKKYASQTREQGSIEAALYIEKMCDRVYARLPEWARW